MNKHLDEYFPVSRMRMAFLSIGMVERITKEPINNFDYTQSQGYQIIKDFLK